MATTTALIVDDEPDLIKLVEMALQQLSVKTIGATNLQEARRELKNQSINFCLTDMKLPDGLGIDLVREIHNHYPHIPVAVITAFGNMDTAVESLKAGAFDYVAKPLDLEVLRKMVRQAATLNATMLDAQSLETTEDHILEQQLIGQAQNMMALKKQIQQVAKSQAPIFISGESGTGKEVVARCIHSLSSRKEGPFIAVNCGAIPSELIESELFGHKKGSFSGAIHDKLGLFKAADGGTLFLDEVADIPLAMQVKLLRVIQEKKCRSVGATQEEPIDCRILSATHKNLTTLIANNQFRDDLYYRINVIELSIPPLRDRGRDILMLAHTILTTICRETDQSIKTLSEASQQLLLQHRFTGNVRELQNALHRACALCDQTVIEPEHLQLQNQAQVQAQDIDSKPVPTQDISSNGFDSTLFSSLEDYLLWIEKNAIEQALQETQWNRTAAAKQLGMSFRSLRYKLKKLGLDE